MSVTFFCVQRTRVSDLLQGDAVSGSTKKPTPGEAAQAAPEHTTFADVLRLPCDTDVVATMEGAIEAGAERDTEGRQASQDQGNASADVRLK
jgi:hypothetical protein